MSEAVDDWRLQGQERFLYGVTLHRANWVACRAGWDHDHCEFCWAKFGGEELPDVLSVGYTTTDSYRWICEQCFEDFRERLKWRVES
jgi:hypothetical protein